MPDPHTLTKASKPDRPKHVLFFASVPPAEVRSQMAKAWQAFGTGEIFRHDKLHLSVHTVAGADDLDPMLVRRARQAVNVVRTAPFTLRFDRLTRYSSNNTDYALVIATNKMSDGLSALASELHTACRALGITASQSNKPNPHVTLAYGSGLPEPRLLDEPILWTVDEIALIDSLQGKGSHVELGRWPLPRDREQQSFDF